MRKKYKRQFNKFDKIEFNQMIHDLKIQSLKDKIDQLIVLYNEVLKVNKDLRLEQEMDAFDRSLKTTKTKSPFKKSVCSVCKSSDCDLY